MTRINCSGVYFGSPLDEKHLFEWGAEIPGFVRWERDDLIIRSRLSQASLRDLIALLHRYSIPTRQLAQFRTASNEHWFAAPQTYWHQKVFGEKPQDHGTPE